MQIVRPLRHRRAAYATAARELHLWLLQVLAWVATRVRLPRILRLDFQDEVRKARRDIRVLIFLGMCSRMTFRRRDLGKRSVAADLCGTPCSLCAGNGAVVYRLARCAVLLVGGYGRAGWQWKTGNNSGRCFVCGFGDRAIAGIGAA